MPENAPRSGGGLGHAVLCLSPDDGMRTVVRALLEASGLAVVSEVERGLDVGKTEHHATAITLSGEPLFDQSVRNERAFLGALLDAAQRHGTPALMIDQPGSIAALTLAVARERGVPVASIPGLVMRRAANLYPARPRPTPPTAGQRDTRPLQVLGGEE